MTYFRQPKNSNNSRKSLDGFITRPNSTSVSNRKDVQSRFRTAYSPDSMSEKARSGDNFSGVSTRSSSNPLKDTKQNANNEIIQRQNVATNSMTYEENKKTKKKVSKKSKENRKKQGNFKKLSKAFAVVFIALIIGIGSLFGYGYIKARNIFKGDGEGAAALQRNVDPAKLNGEGDGRVNILLVGKGGPGHEAPDLTDTLLLASVDPVQNEAALVSIPRDLFVKDDNGYATKVNAVYSYAKQARLAKGDGSDSEQQAAEDAGLNAIKETVSDVLGIPVHYYIMVDFTAFKDAINTVGGITVDVKEPLYDSSMAWLMGGNPLVAGQGLQSFDGDRALLYARSRKGSARGDFDRTARQQEVIVALQKKVLTIGTFSNPFKVVELLNNMGSHVRTDLNGLDEIKRLYEIGQNIGSDRIVTVGLADPPNILVVTDNINGQSVVVPSAGLYQYDEIRSYIRNNLRDAFLKSEDARVLILNGTSTSGLATATKKELLSYGYNVIGVDNAPTDNYTKNIFIDLTNGEKRYTKSYLEKRLGLSATSTLPEGVPGLEKADFVIILGTDEVNKTSN